MRATDRIASLEPAWLDAFARMIETDTSFPPGEGYGAFADLMESLFAPLGFRFERVEVPEALWRVEGGQAAGRRINLIARRRTGRAVTSIYYHVDTVPPGPAWTRPPLRLTREGDRLYGRGTADMKGTLAATFAALAAAQAEGTPLACDVDLLFCTDEEGGLYPGVRYLAESRMIEGQVMCLNGGAAPRIWAGCFGSLDLAIRIRGRPAHSGDPGRGVNAIEEALPIVAALQALKTRVETRTSTLPPPPHLGQGPLSARLTLAAIHAGAKGSSLPGECTILVNRRYTPDERYEDVLVELDSAVAEAGRATRALAVETTVVGHLTPVVEPDGGPEWERWIAALSRGFGWPRESFRRWGASSSSDMGFVQASGFRKILLGGLVRPDSNAHAADEFTTVTDVSALARAILIYLAVPARNAVIADQPTFEGARS
jgi:succinyl-diaminopimelate desuccinylase